MSQRPNSRQPVGISIIKVNRGDRRCTFPNELEASRLFSLAISQVEEFTADRFFSLAAETVM
jgi:hypothetical protein